GWVQRDLGEKGGRGCGAKELVRARGKRVARLLVVEAEVIGWSVMVWLGRVRVRRERKTAGLVWMKGDFG
ncbi:hypothetical protein HAX54_000923, partial [Datura stramonium]|nr:hypothetical protein [Datura stramonium]